MMVYPPDEVPRPTIKGLCLKCGVAPKDVDEGHVIVSPAGKAHFGGEWAVTACGKDAAGDNWWWPL